MNNYYAVKHGRKNGIFSSWGECYDSIHKFTGAVYKKFKSLKEAEEYLASDDVSLSKRYDSEEDIFSDLREGEAIAYVDGSNKGDGSAFSWGAVIFAKVSEEEITHRLSEKSEDPRFTSYRNVAGELFASVHTVNLARKMGINKLTIYHDYAGIRHWALGEWKTKNELSKHYKRVYEEMMKEISVEFVKVEGHTGDRFNEEADKLAKKALGIK